MSFLSCSIESCSRHIHKTLKDFKMNKNVKNSEHNYDTSESSFYSPFGISFLTA